MRARDIMNSDPMCCLPDTPIQQVAELMVKFDCGSLPVVNDPKTASPLLGVITDRDIVCRAIAKGQNPLDLTARDCMTVPGVAVRPDDSVEHCMHIMEDSQIRRIPVVDERGAVIGIVTQAHIANSANRDQAGELLQSLSRKSEAASHVSAAR